MPMNFQAYNPWEAANSGLQFGSNLAFMPGQLKQQQLANALNEYKRQYEEQRAPNYPTLIKSEADLARLAPQEHQQIMAQRGQEMEWNPKLWQSTINQQGAQTNRINQLLPVELERGRIDNDLQKLARQKELINSKYYENDASANSEKLRIDTDIQKLTRQKAVMESPYYGINAKYESTKKEIDNDIQKLNRQKALAESPYYATNAKSQAERTRIDNDLEKLKRQKELVESRYTDQMAKAKLESEKALAQQRKTGGARAGGVSGQLMNQLMQQIQLENPNFTPEQINEAANAYIEGRNTLDDGTQLKPPGGIISTKLNEIAKHEYSTTLVNQAIQAKQAEAELPIYKAVIDKGIANYGDTIFNHSPKQIADSVNVKDHAAQQRIGEYIAAQQLSYDRSALILKINALPPGKRIADEINRLSYAAINEKFPMMSAEARLIAANIVAKALSDGLKARQSVDIGAASLNKKVSENMPNKSDNDPLGIR